MRKNKIILEIENRINRGFYSIGEKMPSERNLAEELNVGRAPIRVAFAELVEKGWLDTSDGRSRFVSTKAPTPLGDAESLYLAVIGKKPTSMSNGEIWYPSQKELHGIRLAMEKNDLTGMFYPNPNNMQKIVDSLQHTLPRGIIYFTGMPESDNFVFNTLKSRIPIVAFRDTCLVENPNELSLDTVESDHEAGARMIINTLAKNNCKKIIYFTSNIITKWQLERFNGSIKACNELNIDITMVKSINLISHKNIDEFQLLCKKLAEILKEYINTPNRPDAIVAASDATVSYIGRALELLGVKANQDILVTGYDNYFYACPEQQWFPLAPFLTVEKNDIEIGAGAVELLLQRSSGALDKSEYIRKKFNPTLIQPLKTGGL